VTSDVVAGLQQTPVPLSRATADPADGGVPAERGLYAWWASARALPGIDGPPHPGGELELLYVGIAPNGPGSKATLRSRLVGNHIRGTTGQSTLRRSLAALLSEREGWRSRWTTRPVLMPDDEERLTAWMDRTLRLTWDLHEAPWTVERAVIEQLGPPLNQSENAAHPLYRYVRDTRARWREAARGSGAAAQ